MRPLALVLIIISAAVAAGCERSRAPSPADRTEPPIAQQRAPYADVRALGGLNPVEAFRTLWQRCPESLAATSARLYAEYLRAAIEADRDEKNPYSMSEGQKAAAAEQVKIILADDQLARASFP